MPLARIQFSAGQNGVIDSDAILNRFPWIVEPNQLYVISPDSDGFLSALLLCTYLKGRIVGFYDGKICLIHKDVSAKDCIFLDIDINRADIKSIGHHLVTFNKLLTPVNVHYTSACIQPNIIRGFDGKKDFQAKYPFGTVHLLIEILYAAGIIKSLSKNSIWPLLFTDGVWNNLFGYTENCIDWIRFLGIDRKENILNPLFCSGHHSFYNIMLGLNDFLRMRDTYNATGFYTQESGYKIGGRNKRTGDKLRLTNSSGLPINLVRQGKTYSVHEHEKDRVEKFISSISGYVMWSYDSSKWSWNDLRLMQFTKGDFSKLSLTNGSFTALMAKNPLSLAMTDSINIEYTLEEPDRLL